MSVEWLIAHQDDPDLIIVDARPREAHGLGHIPGSLNSDIYALKLPISRAEIVRAWVERMRGELQRLGVRPSSRVVFYEEISGTSAARGVWVMDLFGLPGGALLDGGLTAWRRAGGQLTRAVREPAPSTLDVTPRMELLVTADELVASITKAEPELRILDTRSEAEWEAGSIPGAVHLEWAEALNPDGSMRPPDELREALIEAGIDPADNRAVVTFCSGGYRSSHSYLVLRSLGIPAKNYAPSWGEWGRRGDLPITARIPPAPWEEE